MILYTAAGLLIPLLGTSAGAACVFFMKGGLDAKMHKSLLGFASGIMVAASVWSLLIPAIEESAFMGKLAFVPAMLGTAGGMAFLPLLDRAMPHMRPQAAQLDKNMMLMMAVTLHNIPEGMAPGVVFADALRQNDGASMAGAFALSIGIAIQNFPEGAVISMPSASNGESRGKAFIKGVLSGAVEPAAALITLFISGFISALLPYLLAFAAGAMLYVVADELIPEASDGNNSGYGTTGFAAGFILMMILDVALG